MARTGADFTDVSPRDALRGHLRSWLASFGIVVIGTLGAWWLATVQPGWAEFRDSSSPPDIAFTGLPLVFFVAGIVSGLVGRARAGWIPAAIGLAVGSLVAAGAWEEPRFLEPTLWLLELLPLTLGDAIGSATGDRRRRPGLIVVFSIGLWLPFALLAVVGVLAAASRPGLGEKDVTTVVVAVLVAVLVPFGLLLMRSGTTRRAGRSVLLIAGCGVAVWALFDGGYGRPLWDARVAPPLVAVMLAGAVLGSLVGLAAALGLAADVRASMRPTQPPGAPPGAARPPSARTRDAG